MLTFEKLYIWFQIYKLIEDKALKSKMRRFQSIQKGDKMKLNLNIFAIFAVLCVMLSAGAVCAQSDAAHMATDSGNHIVATQDGQGIGAVDHHIENANYANGGNSTMIPADAAHKDPGLTNSTNSTNPTNSTNLHPAAGNNLNATTNSTNTTNSTHAAGGNIHNATAHKLPETGNPVLLALLAMGAAGSVCAIKRRK